jgi:hypothetical protein
MRLMAENVMFIIFSRSFSLCLGDGGQFSINFLSLSSNCRVAYGRSAVNCVRDEPENEEIEQGKQ